MSVGVELGRQVKALREANGYTQDALGKLCGLGKGQISKIERDATHSSVAALFSIGEWMGRILTFVDPAMLGLGDKVYNTGIIGSYLDSEDAIPHIQKRMMVAKHIRILLVRGWRVIGEEESKLTDIIRSRGNSANIRILLLNPDSEHVRRFERETSYTPGTLGVGIRLTIDTLEKMRKEDNVDLVYKLYDNFPMWRLIFVDDVVFVGFYLPFFKAEASTSSVHYLIEKRNPFVGPLFHSFERYYNYLWEDGKIWK